MSICIPFLRVTENNYTVLEAQQHVYCIRKQWARKQLLTNPLLRMQYRNTHPSGFALGIYAFILHTNLGNYKHMDMSPTKAGLYLWFDYCGISWVWLVCVCVYKMLQWAVWSKRFVRFPLFWQTARSKTRNLHFLFRQSKDMLAWLIITVVLAL